MIATREVTLATKVRQVTGLAGLTYIDEQTRAFLEFVEESTQDGKDVSRLTPAQTACVYRLWSEHFA